MLASTAHKIICMARHANLGELVKAWREKSGLTQPEMARRIGHGVKYQNLQQLETGRAKRPLYLVHLAKFMGTTAEDLQALREPPPLGVAAVPPDSGAGELDEPTARNDEEMRLLRAFRRVFAEDRAGFLNTIETRAVDLKAVGLRYLRERFGATEALTDDQVVEGFRRAALQNGHEPVGAPPALPAPKSKVKR